MKFNLREEILKEYSKTQSDKIVKWVGSSQERFNELFHLFLSDEYRVVQRAARIVSYSAVAHPEFMKKNFGKFITNLKKPDTLKAVKRNSVRLLQFISTPEKYHGDIMSICFDFLQSPTETIAVKVFSLTVLANLAKQYPEILPEIKSIVEEHLPNQSAGFKSRVKKVIEHRD
jgi:hypothetical protein